MKTRFCLLTLCFLLLCSTTARATIYYVAKAGDGGSDSNTCTQAQTRTTPKLTISAGIDCLTAAGVGHTLYIRSGTYTERLYAVDGIPGGTSWADPSTYTKIAGDPGDTAKSAIIKPSSGIASRVIQIFGNATTPRRYIWFDNLDLDGSLISHYTVELDGINIAGSGFIRISNSDIHGSPSSGIITGRLSNNNEFLNNRIFTNGTAPITGNCCGYGAYIQTDNNLVERNEIYDHTGYGIHVYNGFATGDTRADSNRIRYNYVHDNCTALVGAPGVNGTDASNSANILIGSGDGNIAEYNIVEGCPFGIMVGFNGATNSKVYHNTAWGPTTVHGAAIAAVHVRSSASTTTVQNNLVHNHVVGVQLASGATATQTTNSTADPGFVDAAGGNFSLASSSSGTAFDTGTPITGYSFNGTAPDIGALETFTCTSAVIPAAAASTMEITCENALAAPLLPATGCAGFVARKNTVLNNVVSCARTADNVMTLTLADAYAAGNTPDWTYTTVGGTVTDSALIGGTKNQRLNTQSTPQLVTNQVGATAPVLEEVACLFSSPGGTEADPDWSLTAGVNLSLPPGKCATVRCQVLNTVADFGEAGFTFFFDKNEAASYAAIENGPGPTDGIFSPAGTTQMPPELLAGSTTARLADIGDFVAGGIMLSSLEVPNIAFVVNSYTELLFPFCVGEDNDDADTYDLRVYRAGGVPLDTYTQTPRVTVDADGYIARVGAP